MRKKKLIKNTHLNAPVEYIENVFLPTLFETESDSIDS